MPIIEQLPYQIDKSSYGKCSIKKTAHNNFAIFAGIICAEVSFGTRLTKKRVQQKGFPANIAKFPITPVLKKICIRLLLKIIKKDFLEMPWVAVIITWYIWAVKGQRLVVIDRWLALICSAVKRERKKRKHIHFTTFWNFWIIKTYFRKLISLT